MDRLARATILHKSNISTYKLCVKIYIADICNIFRFFEDSREKPENPKSTIKPWKFGDSNDNWKAVGLTKLQGQIQEGTSN